MPACSAEGEASALGHGIAGVDGEVDEDLFDLAAVGADVDVVGVELGLEDDVLAEEGAKEVVEVVDDLVEVEDFGLDDLLAAEGEELACEGAGACGGAEDFGGFGLGAGGLFGEVVVEDFAVAADGGEEVVEVVGDAAGEEADGLHFLGLEELLFAFGEGGFGAVAGVDGAEDVGDALEEGGGVAGEVAGFL